MAINLFEDFLSSNLSHCFIPAGDGIFHVKIHTDAPDSTEYILGSVGDSLGTPERFKIIECPHLLLAVGDKSTVIRIAENTINLEFPTFVRKSTDYDGYKNISPHYEAPSYRVGRLVGLVWLPKPDGTDVIDHLSGERGNDELSNLEWVSYSENIRRGRVGTRRRWNKNDYAIMFHREHGILWCHPRDIARITGSRNLSKVLNIPNKHSLKGWYPIINPTADEALEFIAKLPFSVDENEVVALFDDRLVA